MKYAKLFDFPSKFQPEITLNFLKNNPNLEYVVI